MYKYRRVIISVIALLLAAAILTGLLVTVFAANSADIRTEISGLESKQDELDQKKQELEAQIAANNTQTLNVVEQKAQIDQEIELTRQEVENLNEQIRQYNLLIAEKQAELDQLQTDQNDLLDRYKQRIRAMQEQGDVSYWSIIFGAKTFSEMLNRVSMVEEIAQSDQRMLKNMRQIATEVLSAKEELAGEKVSLEEKKTELASAQETLTAKRADSDELLQELVSDADLLRETNETYEAMLEDLTEQIAEKEKEYTDAKRAEDEAAKNNNNNNNNGGNNGGNSGGNNGGNSGGTPSASGFLFPLPAGSGVVITSPYGYRYHPIDGGYRFHNGVDLAVAQGTPVYATKSGTVTTATFSSGYGYYVTINHGDGFSSLYGHMTHYTVSSGDYVNQGDLIGYVGSTGYSTGPHLHFTMFYNGATVNPMDYVSIR
mgnify:CR=1 FL=1|jgi:murein DD-endopeptidase MepM/ murein hydrolase activator NlpD